MFSDKQFHKINFEDLLHVLEQINAYKSSWDEPNTPNRYIPFFAPFTKSNVSASLDYLSDIMRKYMQIIMSVVNDYNDYYINNQKKEEWYGKLFADKNNWDIFNLNYDTTIEQCLGEYEDGYEEVEGRGYYKFNPAKLFDNKRKLSTINHLHGCILYDNKPDLNVDTINTELHDIFKFSSYNEVLNRKEHCVISNPTNQAGEPYWGGSIITGLHKTEKNTYYPYSFYHANLVKSILRNNALVIVGYSFGDIYINNIIRNLCLTHGEKTRVVLIDKWNLSGKYDGKCGFDNYILREDKAGIVSFMGKVSEDTNLSNKTFEGNIKNNPLLSKNKKLMLFIDGAKEAATHSEEILNFIDN